MVLRRGCRVERELDLLAARETGFGRQWSCADRGVQTFLPFAIVAPLRPSLRVRGSRPGGRGRYRGERRERIGRGQRIGAGRSCPDPRPAVDPDGAGDGRGQRRIGRFEPRLCAPTCMECARAKGSRRSAGCRDLVAGAREPIDRMRGGEHQGRVELSRPTAAAFRMARSRRGSTACARRRSTICCKATKLLRIAFAAARVKISILPARGIFRNSSKARRQAGGALAISWFDVFQRPICPARRRRDAARRRTDRPSGRVALSASGADPMLARLGAPVGLLRDEGCSGPCSAAARPGQGDADGLAFTSSTRPIC